MKVSRDKQAEDFESIFLAGALTGLLAGLLMLIVAMLQGAAQGSGPALPLLLIAALLDGAYALVGGWQALAAGLALHLLASLTLGVVFAAHVDLRPFGPAVVRDAALFSALIWALMTYLVLPAADPTMSARVALTPAAWFLDHLVFGLALSVTPFLRVSIQAGFED